MIERYIIKPYRSWRASLEERELTCVEDDMRGETDKLSIVIVGDNRIPEVIRRLKRDPNLKRFDAEELKCIAFAELYVPEDSADNVPLLRDIFGRGSYHLNIRRSLRDLAKENNISWRECLGLYRKASMIVFDALLARAKFELTAKT